MTFFYILVVSGGYSSVPAGPVLRRTPSQSTYQGIKIKTYKDRVKDKEQEDNAQAQGLANNDSNSPENASGSGIGSGLGLENSTNNSLATLDALAGRLFVLFDICV